MEDDGTGYSDTPQPKVGKDILLGMGLTFLLHLGQVVLAPLFGFLSLIFIGVTQGIYILPAMILAGVKKRAGIVIGLLIGAAVTFLLNGILIGVACAAVLKSFKGR